MPQDLDIRLLRYYVVVAEELHFSRAAQRLFIAQQALSRDIQRLESILGMTLINRTTRRVSLTSAGRKLLGRAREIVALHDLALQELVSELSPLTVDVVGPGLTPSRILSRARELAPRGEFFARYLTGAEEATPLLLSGDLDVTFGRNPKLPGSLQQQIIRYERLCVLLPLTHPLAQLNQIPLETLRGEGLCFRAGDQATQGWEHAALQLLAGLGIDAIDAHPHVQGVEELAQHLHSRNAPILTLSTQPEVPGGVYRPLVDPVALFPWTMIWRRGADPNAIEALLSAAQELGDEFDWLTMPSEAWLPQPERDQH
ncbi:LysR family transcriptional regulator [Psychromicrobium lacuslunae]|uniref:LysR family transcriptional regulator n=1 Tax=Psychromicrobium lacuslunae TaxID=1618207 RepID=A0A0D4BXL3_9MICC|nr:LysR family transcriptional regulator [Psychromicrobium lacuslunae]AJT41053.1 LysR family transcriptional regulator [Psychromicrobium lacuslunae]